MNWSTTTKQTTKGSWGCGGRRGGIHRGGDEFLCVCIHLVDSEDFDSGAVCGDDVSVAERCDWPNHEKQLSKCSVDGNVGGTRSLSLFLSLSLSLSQLVLK